MPTDHFLPFEPQRTFENDQNNCSSMPQLNLVQFVPKDDNWHLGIN